MTGRLFPLAGCLAAASLALLLSGPAQAKKDEPPANSPPPLSEAERNVGTPGVPFSDVIEAAGDAVIAQGAVPKGQALLTIPYGYRYMAVLTEDVTGFSFTVSGVQAPAGSPGYYVGSFVRSNGYFGTDKQPPMDMWCFLPRVAGGKRENICLLRDQAKYAAIAPTRMNPYLWTRFSPATGSFDYVHTPIFERRAVTLPITPVLEYRLLNWEKNVARFEIFAMGKSAGPVLAEKDADGAVRLRTVAGDFIVTRDPNAKDAAFIRRAEAPTAP
jgi:hypothetical protein